MFGRRRVRVPMDRIVFPPICPVCGEPATVTAPLEKRIPGHRHGTVDSMGKWEPGSNYYIEPATCEYHARPRLGDKCRKAAVGAVVIVALALVLVLLNPFLGNPRDFVGAVSTAVIMHFCMSAVQRRSTPLGLAIRIKKIEPETGTVVLEFQHDWYAEAFIQANMMTAEELF